jgi:predicted nucleotidyltransferase component of viral defense system
MRPDRELCELFHFLFLERLLRMTSPQLYALKGGVNLRFFHQSPRYSEDMDLDAHSDRVAVDTLRKNGYKLLADKAFRRVLMTSGIADLQVNDPSKAKQLETTQRFRVTLILDSGQHLPTKVEFSRRGIEEAQTVTERIDAEVARRHGRTAYNTTHYVGSAAARQKIAALAGRPQTQARDLFDLALLDARGAVDATVLDSIGAAVRERAAAAVSSLDYTDWDGQVLEYLDDERADDYRSQERFEQIQLATIELLERGR